MNSSVERVNKNDEEEKCTLGFEPSTIQIAPRLNNNAKEKGIETLAGRLLDNSLASEINLIENKRGDLLKILFTIHQDQNVLSIIYKIGNAEVNKIELSMKDVTNMVSFDSLIGLYFLLIGSKDYIKLIEYSNMDKMNELSIKKGLDRQLMALAYLASTDIRFFVSVRIHTMKFFETLINAIYIAKDSKSLFANLFFSIDAYTINAIVDKLTDLSDKKKEKVIAVMPNEEKLLEFLGENLKYCNKKSLYEKSFDLSGITKGFKKKTQKSLSPILCQNCSMIKVPINLECGHSTSMCCLKKQIRKLEASSYMENFLSLFNKCSCSICHRNYSLDEIKTYADEEYKESLLDIKKKCEKCKKELPLITHYWTELPCLDLCCNCYMDSLVNHSDCCEICNLPLVNKEVTFTRQGKCSICQEVNFMPFHLRTSIKGFTLCLNSLKELGNESQELSLFMQVKCVKCREAFNFFDTYSAPCCKVPVCKSCISIQCNACKENISKLSISRKKCCEKFVTTPAFLNLECTCFDH